MMLESLAIGILAKTFYDVNKSFKTDEQALQKYSRAFEKSQEAELLVKAKAEYTDMRLMNVAKKKRAIIQYTVPRFVEVYSKIQKICLDNKNSDNEIIIRNSVQNLSTLNTMTLSAKKEFTDKELVCGYLTKGIGGLIRIESERNLSAARNQMRAANVIYSQAKSISEVYDAIVGRADRISNLLMAMNMLFIKSINETDKTIKINGLDVKKYNDYDKGVLMTCVNMASAMSDIVNIPVVDENGKMCESAIQMIQTGESYVEKMNNILQS